MASFAASTSAKTSDRIPSSSRITNAAFIPPPTLVNQLQAVRDPARVSDELVQEATETALGFLLSTRPPPLTTAAASDKGKEPARNKFEQVVHWYCGQFGAHECWEPATFLIRLLGFKRKDEVAEWRDRFELLMSTCPDCVEAYQRAKRECLDRYLRLYKPDKSVQNFHNGVESIERNAIFAQCVQAGFDVPASASDPNFSPTRRASLASLPICTIQNILTNRTLFENDNIVAMLLSALPLSDPFPLPSRPTAGLLAFRLHETRELRELSRVQLDRYRGELSSDEYRANGIGAVLDSHLGVIASRDRGDVDAVTGIHMYYTTSKLEFWTGMAACLRVLSADAIRNNLLPLSTTPGVPALNVVKIVASHLGDRDENELDALGQICVCLKLLLEKLGKDFWPQNEHSYPETVMHSIMHNFAFESAWYNHPLLAQPSSTPFDAPWVGWIPPFLLSVAHSPSVFTDGLATITRFFFYSAHVNNMPASAYSRMIQVGVALLTDIFITNPPASAPTSSTNEIEIVSTSPPRYPHATAAIKVLDLHAKTFSEISFPKSGSFSDPGYNVAAETMRTFVASLLKRDAAVLAKAFLAIGVFSRNMIDYDKKVQRKLDKTETSNPQPAPMKPTPPSPITLAMDVWKYVLDDVFRLDPQAPNALSLATTTFLPALGSVLSFDYINQSSWAIPHQATDQLNTINSALVRVRDPIVKMIKWVSDERAERLREILSQPGMVENTVLMLFSPVEDIHNTAQGLVKEAFDVPTRRDVFYRLAQHHPRDLMLGLGAAISSFRTCAKTLPEACGAAKRFVRCFSDVIDVYCATTDGLLRDPDYVARGKQYHLQPKLLRMWELMADSLALLFRKTPDWARFYANEEMTSWMRDAILFGTDMLDQIRVFEAVISFKALDRSTTIPGSPDKLDAITAKESRNAALMITALANPLEELLAWLRLNDSDLLQHAFHLVHRMLNRFTRSGVELRESIVTRLMKLSNRGDGTAAEKRSTILREDQLMELREAVDANTLKGQARVQRGTGKARPEVIEIESDDDSSRSSSSKSLRIKSAVNVTSGTLQSKLPYSSVPGRAPPSKAKPTANVSARAKGVPWTTYSLSKKTSDSSGSESSDDENKVNGKRLTGLALLAKDQKPAIKKSERRQIKMVDIPGAVNQGPRGQTVSRFGIRKEDQQAARAARLRAAQDFSRLHRQILQWDPTSEDSSPPDFEMRPKLAGSFRSAEEYFAAFEPLLLTECWEQIRQSRIEAAQEGQVLSALIAGRQSVDDFVDVFCTVEHGQMRDRIYYGDSDLVLLRQGQRQLFAKIQAASRKREFFELTLRCHLGKDMHDAGSALSARTKWELLKLANLSTVHREYAALQALEWLDLCPEILNPRPPPPMQLDARLIQSTMNAYKVNEPQARAIQGSLRTSGFSLIQGPPGTGKTSTIVGLVGAFIDSRPRAAAPIAVGKPTDPSNAPPVAKVLLCAPSNAAVDEVAKRLKEGVRTSDGQLYVPKVVRIGADSSVDISVKEIFIDELVERATSGVKVTSNGTDSQTKMQAMRNEIEGLRLQRDEKQMEMDAVINNDIRRGEINLELKQIKGKIFDLSQRLDSEKDKAQQSKRAMDAEQRKMRIKILSEADVICSTLSGAGHDYMSQLPFDFETVIIDEAAQSIELSSLIPLKYGCTKCILVGDPLQLPPTVISSVAARGGYDRSLFVRVMQRGPQAVHLLSIQYRMHPNISAFPSAAFYDSKLTDGPAMDKKTLQTWHSNALFPPYAFYHVSGSEMAGRHHSWTNPQEAQTALAIYDRLCRDYSNIDFAYRIGIVTPYKGQVGELKRTFRQRHGEEILSRISFNTVDGFQGQEKDIIILSCVRGGSADKGVGFLADTRRMNVALTRARSSIWILGDSNKLRSNQYWSNLVGDAESRGLFRKVDINTFRSGYSAPPTISQAIPVVKSKARAIEMTSAYGSNSADSTQAASPAIPSAPGPIGVKKRLTDALEPVSVAKKPKLDGPPASESRLPAGQIKPAVVPVQRKKAAPSLFVPTKRPPPKR